MRTILFVGGGSIGHVAPCIAVWRALEARNPNARAYFLCGDKEMERTFLERERLSFTSLSRVTILSLLPSLLRAWKILRATKPAALFSSGGALGVPVCIAARVLRIPVILYEANAVSGRANAVIRRLAAAVCYGFPVEAKSGERLAISATRYPLAASRFVYTGHPVRNAITHGSRDEGLRIAGFSGQRPILLVLGGSQGAQALNDALLSALPELLRVADVVHITGEGKSGAADQPGYRRFAFVHEDLPHLYACASLALSRAGAGSISELHANAIPAILVPLPGIAQDHQTANATRAAENSGFVFLAQRDLAGQLLPVLQELLTQRDKREAMKTSLRETVRTDAAETIAHFILSVSQPQPQP